MQGKRPVSGMRYSSLMSTPHPLSRLLAYAQDQRPQIRNAVSFSILKKLFDLAPPALIGTAVDLVVKQDQSLLAKLGIQGFEKQLTVLALGTVLIWGLESLFEYLHKIVWGDLSQHMQHRLRLDAYAHIQKLELGYFENRSTGGLMATLNDDVNQLQRFLAEGANSLIQVATTVLLVSATFLALSPKIAFLAFCPMPFLVLGSFWYQRRIGPRYKVLRERVGDLNGLLANNIQGVATIKSFTAELFEYNRVQAASEAYQKANEAAIRVSSGFQPMIRMVIVVGFTGTLVSGAWLVKQGQIAVGSYSILIFLTQRLLWPLTSLAQTMDSYQQAMASTTRILDLLDTSPQIVDGKTAFTKNQAKGTIEFEDVHFAYPDGRKVLNGLSLTIGAGQTVAVVGATGSGKTTLVKLLLRFYDHQQGQVSLDGMGIQTLSLEDLRKSIGLVSQDVFLFHGSALENIAYGVTHPDREKASAAALTAEAATFIEALPEGYDTVLGERGKKLSGGQRQRLSLARAVYKDPPILILDEATSAVDNETEAAIQRSMKRIRKDRTVLVIAHRLSTVRDADTIYVMDQGQVTEAGTHEELVKLDGIYSSLWKVQTGELV